ncbi:MAG: TIM barrel protein [Planctomycetota bacterium]
MFVSASTTCFENYSMVDAIDRMNDLEYSAVNISIGPDEELTPNMVVENFDKAISYCRDTHRLDIAGYDVYIGVTGEEHYEQFQAICKLAKATKVVSITIPSAELGTPFNEEVEHLRRLVQIASKEGVLVSIRTQIGRLSEDADTVVVLCDNVEGLGVTLDPSTFVCGPHAKRGYDKLLNYVYHVELRDTSKEEFQVRVGQGEIEYSKLITQLRRCNYQRALDVRMDKIDGTDHNSEMRKIRLLLESLL